jgi:hypothetical protein
MKRFLLLSVALVQFCVASAAEPELVAFWNQPEFKLPAKLLPAKLELVGRPDLSRTLAMFDPDHKVTNPAVQPFVKEAEENYRVVPAGFVKGAKPFADRKYVLEEVPQRLAGLTQLQTRMSHKSFVDARFGIVLKADRPVHLFLAIDQRMLSTFLTSGAPTWMQDFAPTGDRILSDDPLMKAQGLGYLVFVRQCLPGRIVLGPCGADPKYNSMYMVFAGEAEPAAK